MKKQIDFGGTPLEYSVIGTGPALVLIHGFTETSYMWEGMIEALSRQFKLIIPELPGHGKSRSFGTTHSMDAIAERLMAVLHEEKTEEMVVVGHSMGGYISLALAQMWGIDKVKGICLFHSHAGADSPDAREMRLRTIQAVEQGHDFFIRQFIPDLFPTARVDEFHDLIELLKSHVASMSASDINASLRGMMERPDRLDFLITSRIPVLFIAGALDKRIPYNTVISQAQALEIAELLLLRDVAHMGWAENTSACEASIFAFARKWHRL